MWDLAGALSALCAKVVCRRAEGHGSDDHENERRIWCAGSSITAAARDAARRIEARIAEQASSQNSPHRTHGGFFPRRRRSRIARCRPGHHHAIIMATETGRAIPRAAHTRGEVGRTTSDRNIEPEGRSFRASGSVTVGRHRTLRRLISPAMLAGARRQRVATSRCRHAGRPSAAGQQTGP